MAISCSFEIPYRLPPGNPLALSKFPIVQSTHKTASLPLPRPLKCPIGLSPSQILLRGSLTLPFPHVLPLLCLSLVIVSRAFCFPVQTNGSSVRSQRPTRTPTESPFSLSPKFYTTARPPFVAARPGFLIPPSFSLLTPDGMSAPPLLFAINERLLLEDGPHPCSNVSFQTVIPRSIESFQAVFSDSSHHLVCQRG